MIERTPVIPIGLSDYSLRRLGSRVWPPERDLSARSGMKKPCMTKARPVKARRSRTDT